MVDIYCELLQIQRIPAMTVIFTSDVDNGVSTENIRFQQNGIPHHFTLVVRNYCNDIFEIKSKRTR